MVRTSLLCSLASQDEEENVVDFYWNLNLTPDSAKVFCSSSDPEKTVINRTHCNYELNQHLALMIEDVQQSDSGTYICKVQTNRGHDFRQIILKVTSGFHRKLKHNSKPRNTPT